jgi:hypothetical protein
MRQTYNPTILDRIVSYGANFPRKTAVGIILIVALLAFEIFNFDTTRYALRDLLGDVRFANLEWAAILAIAFCSIDFAGLTRIFTREKGADEPKEVWYLLGAWLLGASMNAIMTWWAVSLTLLQNEFGNEVMSREELLRIVPVFVAVLVWLTRILFIGSFTVAGEHFFEFSGLRQPASPRPTAQYRESTPRQKPATQQSAQPANVTRKNVSQSPRRITPAPKPKPRQTAVPQTQMEDLPHFLNNHERELVYEDINNAPSQPTPGPIPPSNNNNANNGATYQRPVAKRKPAQPTQPRPSRIKQRPPLPNGPRRQ